MDAPEDDSCALDSKVAKMALAIRKEKDKRRPRRGAEKPLHSSPLPGPGNREPIPLRSLPAIEQAMIESLNDFEEM